MSEPTVSGSPPPLDSSSAAPPAGSVLSSLSLVVLLELELLLPPPQPATTMDTAPTRSTARKAASRVLLDKRASDQKIAGPAEPTPEIEDRVCPMVQIGVLGLLPPGDGHPTRRW